MKQDQAQAEAERGVDLRLLKPIHKSKATKESLAKYQDRLTAVRLPSCSRDFIPTELLWKRVKKQATRLRWFPKFAKLVESVETTLAEITQLPAEIVKLMARYSRSLGELAA